MRIIAGKHRGRKLYGFDFDGVRPTSDKAREGLFAVLQNVNGYNFLDLFCGSGAIGLEAESRGASVTMVDLSKQSIALTEKNAKLISSNAKIYCQDAIRFLKNVNEQFDIIFADPPYSLKVGEDLAVIINDKKLLRSGGLFILETDEPTNFNVLGLKRVKEKKYGKNIFTFYEADYE